MRNTNAEAKRPCDISSLCCSPDSHGTAEPVDPVEACPHSIRKPWSFSIRSNSCDRPVWGAPQTGLSHEFERIENDHGFLIECGHASTGSTGSAVPWESGEQHKELMSQGRFASAFVFLIRDHGHGRVTVDGDGNSVHTYPFDDAQDQRIFRRGFAELARLHQAAGAHEI